MDRGKRWDRVKIAVDGLVHGQGEAVGKDGDYVTVIEARYEGRVSEAYHCKW